MKKNNFKSLMQAAVLICTPLAIASCDDVFGDVDNPIPSHLTVSQAAVNLELHADRPDAATFIRKGIAASGAQLVYSSTNEKVATVDEAGKITAVGEGDCKIIVKATGLDGNGKPTYQEAEDSFAVKVKDYRARIALKEGSKTAVFNSALVDATKPIDLAKVLDVWPSQGTTGLKIEYGTIDATTHAFSAIDPDNLPTTVSKVIQSISTDGKITLKSSYTYSATKHNESVKIAAHIKSKPDAFEVTSFKDQQTTAEFTIDVRQGIAYIAGYDEEDKPIIKSMFYLDNDDEGTKPNYTNLSTVLTGSTDAYLKGGWYYLDADCDFDNSIRVQGDINIVLGLNNTLTMDDTGKSIMDDTTKKNYSLNFFKENKAGTVGGINVLTIQDFKAVNFVDGSITAKTLDKIGTVNINGGTFTNLTNIETLNFKDATLGLVGTPGSIAEIGTATINTANNIYAPMTSIATLNIDKGALTGNLDKIGTATISDGSINGKFSGTTLNVKKGSATATPSVTSTSIKAALNIDGGTVSVTAAAAASAITGNVKVNDGKLTVTATANDKFAIVGNVEVAKGTFTAENANYGAVDGTLTGTFKYSTDGTTWKDLTETSTTAPYIKFVAPTAAP